MSELAVGAAGGFVAGAAIATGEYVCLALAVPALASNLGLAAAGAATLAAGPLIATVALVAVGGAVFGFLAGGVWWLSKKYLFGSGKPPAAGAGGGGAAGANAAAGAAVGGGPAATNIAGAHRVVTVSDSEVEELKKKLQQKDDQIAKLLRRMATQKRMLASQADDMQTLKATVNAILLSLNQPPMSVAKQQPKAQEADAGEDDDDAEEEEGEEEEEEEEAEAEEVDYKTIPVAL